MELGDDLVELLLEVLGIGGELGGDVAQDCEFLGQLYGNADERAIGAEELVDLLGHRFILIQLAVGVTQVCSDCYPCLVGK